MCGENWRMATGCGSDRGSPPRVRGKPRGGQTVTATPGITPACAGKTRGRGLSPPPYWDHPRVCGENVKPEFRSYDAPGSPPRVRGKRRRTGRGFGGAGITPACAGKTKGLSAFLLLIWDHPRVCGENSSSGRMISVTRGSPPRVRGKPALHQFPHARYGITPACAGKTGCGRMSRVRGAGSPPRVRGKQNYRG